MKIGIYGGSFNPVHFGHVNLARGAVASLALDRLIVIPANVSPFKTEAESQAALRQAVAEVGGHSALLGWLVADEVPQTQLETVANANRFLHAIDPHHPTYAALNRTYNVRSALGCFDAFGMDPYPIGNPFCGDALNAAKDFDYEILTEKLQNVLDSVYRSKQ